MIIIISQEKIDLSTRDSTIEQLPTAKWILVILLGSLTAFGPLSMDMYLPALPQISSDLTASTSLVQLSLTATLFGLGFGQLTFGPLSDIHGRRKPLTITLVGFILSSVLIALSPNIIFFIIFRFTQGFTAAAGIVIARASARDLYSGKDLTKFIALLALVNGAAPILAPIFGGVVLNFTTWVGVFYILGLIGVIMLLGVFLFLPETLTEENRAERGIFAVLKTFKGLLLDRFFMSIALTQAFVMSSMFAYIAGSPFVLQNLYGVTPQQFSLFFALNGIGIVIMAQLAGRLAGVFTEVRLLTFGVMMSVIGSFLLMIVVFFKLPLFFMATALLIVVSSVGMISTTSFSLAMEAQGKSAGSASAFLGLLPFVGGGIVSPLVGIAGDTSAVPMATIIASCSLLALCALFLARSNISSIK